MPVRPETISQRKKEHIELCLTDEVSFKKKKNGFEKYDFLHYAITEVDIDKINFETKFLKKKIGYPFLISCMTGGTPSAGNINSQLSVAANNLNIPLGVGSQRQAFENKNFHDTYKIIRKNAPKIPVLGNIGASQIVTLKDLNSVKFLIDLVEADAMVVHVNPLQELLQKNGEPSFTGLLKKLEKLINILDVPVIVKEVGAGISKKAAGKLLSAGVKGIDVAGAGGTSWSAVEILRNKENGYNALSKEEEDEFREWGIPTSYCVKTVHELKKKYRFSLIASGGIYNAFDIAKALALGADLSASARVILQQLDKKGIEGVEDLIKTWFKTLRKIMFLTGSQSISDLRKNKLIKKESLY